VHEDHCERVECSGKSRTLPGFFYCPKGIKKSLGTQGKTMFCGAGVKTCRASPNGGGFFYCIDIITLFLTSKNTSKKNKIVTFYPLMCYIL
jgi:hypothetical protein